MDLVICLAYHFDCGFVGCGLYILYKNTWIDSLAALARARASFNVAVKGHCLHTWLTEGISVACLVGLIH